MVSGVPGGGRFVEHVLGKFSWPNFIAVQLWISALFLLYVTANELNELLGDGELFKIFFTRRSSRLKSARRARIRLLTRLSRLTDAHPLAVLEDPGHSSPWGSRGTPRADDMPRKAIMASRIAAGNSTGVGCEADHRISVSP